MTYRVLSVIVLGVPPLAPMLAQQLDAQWISQLAQFDRACLLIDIEKNAKKYCLTIDLTLHPVQVARTAQFVVMIEAVDQGIVISPLLKADGICPLCWHLRRLAAWTASRPALPNDINAGELLQFYRAAALVQHEWTTAQADRIIGILQTRLQECCLPEKSVPTQKMLHIVLPTGAVEAETVLPRPDCLVCRPYGSAGINLLNPSYSSIVGSVAGLITLIAEVPPLLGEPKFPAVVRATLSNTWLATEVSSLSAAAGKGFTLADATENALGEAIERYAAAVVPTTLTTARSADLDQAFISSAEVYGFTNQQSIELGYAAEEAPIKWAITHSLDGHRPTYAPASAVYTRLPVQFRVALAGPFTTNGLAYGSTLTAAITAAFTEVVERHAFFAVWYGLQPAVGIRLDSICESRVQSALDEFQHCGLEIKLIHLGVHWGIHGVAACCLNKSRHSQRPAFALGLGRSKNVSDAVAAAVLEMGQVYRGLTWALRESSTYLHAQSLLRDPLLINTPHDHALFYACRAQANCPTPFKCSIEHSLSAFAQLSNPCIYPQRAVFVDLTSPDIAEICAGRVVRVLVPNLLPYHVGARYIPRSQVKTSVATDLQLDRLIHPLC